MKARTRQRWMTFGLGIPTALWSVAYPWIFDSPLWVEVSILAIGAGCTSLHLTLYANAKANDFWASADKIDWNRRYHCACGHPLGMHTEHSWAPLCIIAVADLPDEVLHALAHEVGDEALVRKACTCHCEGYVRRPAWHRRLILKARTLA